MKKHIKIFNILLLLLALCSSAWASSTSNPDWALEKKKTYSKSYPLNNNSSVSIFNSFGNVTVSHWNKNEVQVEITIIVKANDDRAAQAILDAIKIFDRGGDDIHFETNVEIKGKKGNNNSMQINYQVNIPASTKLKVNNSFGNTFIPNRTGMIELRQAYGNLTTGALANAKELTVEFGKLKSEMLQNTKAKIKFSKVEIDKLSGDFSGDLEFCSKPKIGLSNNIGKINIDAKYSDLTIHLPASLTADFDIETSFGGVINNSSLKLTNQEGKKVNSIKYKSPNNNNKTKISISSEFGKVTLQ